MILFFSGCCANRCIYVHKPNIFKGFQHPVGLTFCLILLGFRIEKGNVGFYPFLFGISLIRHDSIQLSLFIKVNDKCL